MIKPMTVDDDTAYMQTCNIMYLYFHLLTISFDNISLYAELEHLKS